MSDLDDLLQKAGKAIDAGKMGDALDFCRQALEINPNDFTARYWLFWGATDQAFRRGEESPDEVREDREWLLQVTAGSSDTAFKKARAHALRARSRELLGDPTEDNLRVATNDLEEALDLWSLDPAYFEMSRVAIAAAWGEHYAGVNAEQGFAGLYHLLLRELNYRDLNTNLDALGEREAYVGRVLDRVPGYLEWIETVEQLPEAPHFVAEFAGTAPTERFDEMLLLVAGSRNYAGINQFATDSFAPGRRARIATLLRFGASIDSRYDYKGTTVLHHLAALDDATSIRFAVARGADPLAVDNEGETALFWACKLPGRVAAIEALLEVGVDPNAARPSGRTALHTAAGLGRSLDGIELLVAAGADIDATADCRPIHMAARFASLDRVKALVELGADYESPCGTRTPLDEAENERAHDVVKYLQGLLGIVDTGDPWQKLLALARTLGEESLESAHDSGDYGYYEDEDMDPDDLLGDYWDAQYLPNLQSAIDALDKAERDALPGTRDERLEELYDRYSNGWFGIEDE